MASLADITVAILAGGSGTRLRSVVSDRPKVLAEVNGRPFLKYLLDQIASADAREAVLCTGYMSEKVRETFGERYGRLSLAYSVEQKPLGTGGALRLALPFLRSDLVLVMNGDSFVAVDLRSYLNWFLETERAAAMVLAEAADASRYGRVSLGQNGAIEAFEEKDASPRSGWINAGVYLLKKSTLEAIPNDAPFSLEREMFPQLAKRGLYGYPVGASFIDIGTPESYAEAEAFFRSR
jgi:NDP-sugar pyrophosphorylase family protein